jgi:hypothetical protein
MNKLHIAFYFGCRNRSDAFRVKGQYGRTITDFRVAIRRNPKIADDIHGFALQELAT